LAASSITSEDIPGPAAMAAGEARGLAGIEVIEQQVTERPEYARPRSTRSA
jgi:hypothetical protein